MTEEQSKTYTARTAGGREIKVTVPADEPDYLTLLLDAAGLRTLARMYVDVQQWGGDPMLDAEDRAAARYLLGRIDAAGHAGAGGRLAWIMIRNAA